MTLKILKMISAMIYSENDDASICAVMEAEHFHEYSPLTEQTLAFLVLKLFEIVA